MAERIKCAAIKVGDAVWSVPKPGRHHDVIAHILHSDPSIKRVGGDCPQGFVTSAGRFVEREEAMAIATAADQLLPATDNKGVPIRRFSRELFSEDVW